MQKIITLTIVLLLASSTYAQFQKGNTVLGFGLNIQSYKNEMNSYTIPQTTKNTGFSLSGELGFAKKENRLSGFFINGGYGVLKNEFPTMPIANSKINSYNVGGGYFTRTYKSLGKNFFVFGEGKAGLYYSQQNNNKITSNPYAQQFGVNLGLYPGLAYKWNNRFLLELRFTDLISAGYSQREETATNNKKNIQKSFSLSSGLGLGNLGNIDIGARWIIK